MKHFPLTLPSFPWLFKNVLTFPVFPGIPWQWQLGELYWDPALIPCRCRMMGKERGDKTECQDLRTEEEQQVKSLVRKAKSIEAFRLNGKTNSRTRVYTTRRGTTTEDGNSTSLGLGTGKIFKLRAQPGLAAVGSNLCTSLKHIMISNSRSWKQLSRQNGGGVKAAGEGWKTAPPKRNPLEITD